MRLRQTLTLLFGIVLAIVLSLFLDRVLGWIGFPAESVQIAHPANFSETRHNLDFTYHFQTNSQGIRYPEIPLEKPEGTGRIVVVGDSFTEGWGVEADQIFTALLEKTFSTANNPQKFINCGLSGTAPLQYARILFQVCQNYNPDAVLIVLYPNDVTGTPPHATTTDIDQPIVRRTGLDKLLHTLWPYTHTIVNQITNQMDSSTDLVGEMTEAAESSGISQEKLASWIASLPPELVKATNQGEFNGYILTRGLLQPEHWVLSLDISSPEAESRLQSMLAIVEEMINRSQAEGVPVGIVLLPTPFQYDSTYGDVWRQTGTIIRPEWLTETTELEYQMAVWAADEGVPYLNLTDHFRMTYQTAPDISLNYPLDGHWTAEGHRVAAGQIAEWLETWYFQ